MTTVLSWSLVTVALALSGALVPVWLRRRRHRRLVDSCRRVRRQALDVAGDTERFVDFVRTHDGDPSGSPHWRVIRTRRAAVVHATRELRDQDVHLGVRRATVDLCSALAAFDLELHRRRAQSISADGMPGRAAVASERLNRRIDDVETAARFMSIVARVDECREPKQCGCALSA
jgi:hypothetical protein